MVGAYWDDDLGTDSGSAYIYKKPTTGWVNSNQESAKLLASDGTVYDYFGHSVAISDDTIVVGAYGGDDTGSAYIFKNAITENSIENKKDIIDIETSDEDGDYPIAYSLIGGDDLSLLAIDEETGMLSFKTAPDFENPQDTDGDNIYKTMIKLTDNFSESDTYEAFIRVSDVDYEGQMPKAISFEELHKLTASNGAEDNYFGYSTDIDGSTLVVGAYGYEGDTGRVYVYTHNTALDLFEQVAELRASDYAAGDRFGLSVAISGDTVAVGAYWDDDLGTDSGSVYIYEKPTTGWANTDQESAKLLASDGAEGDLFGISVAISADTVVIGAAFDDDSGSDFGSMYIYEKPTTGWVDSTQESAKLLPSDGATADYFGYSVAISGDTVVAGAYGDDGTVREARASGSAYLYEKPIDGWINSNQQTVKLTPSDRTGSGWFGYSVAINADTVVIGAREDDGTGSVYLYEKADGSWIDTNEQSAKLKASDADEGDLFGVSVAIICGDTVVVGANAEDDVDTDSGAVYLFEKPASGWVDSDQESTKLLASDGTASDTFGQSVAISGDTIVAGATGDDDSGSASGSAYVFKAKTSAVNPAIIMYLLN